jgi:hypothetical protein
MLGGANRVGCTCFTSVRGRLSSNICQGTQNLSIVSVTNIPFSIESYFMM